MQRSNAHTKGEIMVLLLLLVSLLTLMALPFLDVAVKELHVAQTREAREEALQIAEAGVNYYQWHLAHFPTDYRDGTNGSGPYVHPYTDLDTQQQIGEYRLTITPPPSGSTIVTIKSVGVTYAHPDVTRTVTVRYGIPSLALYSFLSNDIIWIGTGEHVSGQMQSNGGVRFDGSTNAPVMSAKATYTCPSSQGSPCPTTKNGVWGSGDSSFWQYPVPAVDFSSLTANLAKLKSSAQSGGIYLPPSNRQGYSLVFNSNGTVSVYKVTSLLSTPTGWDVNGVAHNEDTDYNHRTLQFTEPIPANGIMYVEDKVWVEGVVNGRVMVAAAVLPYNANSAPTIYIPNNITYAAKDGSDVLGLLAQKDVVVTYRAPSTLEVDAALVAQNGSAQFFYYPGTIKNTITVFGSIMTYGQWTWTWVDSYYNVVSGYQVTNDDYDGNLVYAPPPGFPLSSSGYKQLSWTSD